MGRRGPGDTRIRRPPMGDAMSDTKNALGMRLRRPRPRTQPDDPEVLALERRAEAITSRAPGDTREPSPTPSKQEPPASPSSGPSSTRGLSTRISSSLREELDRAVVALSGPPDHATVRRVVESALRRELDRLKKEYGGEFPQTKARPGPGGRPA